MKSHEYEFGVKDVLRLLGLPLIPLAVFAAVMHAGAMARVWPPPRPTLDTDRTILVHQADASRARQDADVVLVGDSSCLMDVSAKELSKRLGRRVLNLGTFSYLDLPAHARLLREFFAANPGRSATVVLLMHPEALRRVGPEEYHVAVLQNFLHGIDHCSSTSGHGQLVCLLGLEIFRGRMWSRLVPSPLAGAYGRRHGFSADLERFMEAAQGSLPDLETGEAKGDANYQLAQTLEGASREFRAAMPPGARLFVGITPAPAGFVRANHPARSAEMLAKWSGWLRADGALTNLPATLPDGLFARTTHLNEAGVRVFTDTLAASLPPR